jgi:hypothetical protein
VERAVVVCAECRCAGTWLFYLPALNPFHISLLYSTITSCAGSSAHGRNWPYRLMVRTSPSHGGNPGSNPGRVTNARAPSGAFAFVTLSEQTALLASGIRKSLRVPQRAQQGEVRSERCTVPVRKEIPGRVTSTRKHTRTLGCVFLSRLLRERPITDRER